MPPWVAKEKMGTLLLASEMPVPIPRNRTVLFVDFCTRISQECGVCAERFVEHHGCPSIIFDLLKVIQTGLRLEASFGVCGLFDGALRQANTQSFSLEFLSAQPSLGLGLLALSASTR